MSNRAIPAFSTISFLAILVSLFLLFTPFEEPSATPTMLPKYVAAGVSMFLLCPLIIFSKLRFTQPSLLVVIVLVTLLFHAVIVNPVPPQFALLIAANLALAIVIFEARFAYRKEFEAAVACLLIINVLTLFIQAGLFYFVTHSIYDIHKTLFRSESRVVEDYFNIARFAGIHVEPGTYTNFVSCLLVIYIFSSDFSKKVVGLAVATTISVLMTHSASAVFFVSVLLLIMGWLWRKRITLPEMLMVLGAIVFFVYASNFLDHLLTRFGGNDPSLSSKMLGIDTYVHANVEEKLVGFGFGRDPCIGCHYQDIGVILNLVSRGGIIVTLSFSLLFVRAIRLHGFILATLIFSIPAYCIMYFFEAPIWVFILFAASSRKLFDKRAPSIKPKAAAAGVQPAGSFSWRGVNIPPDAYH